jgi:hypothetical protein
MMRRAAGGTRSFDASDTTIMTANEIGTVHTAGWPSTAPGQPAGSWPVSVARAAVSESVPPTAIPASAPASVSRLHQMPSTSNGQKVDAATVKASATTTARPSRSLRKLNAYGMASARIALSRKDRIRSRRGARSRSPIRLWPSTPATDTARPDTVDRNAAKAPAVTSAPSHTPGIPLSIRSGSSSTVASVSPVSSRSGTNRRPSVPSTVGSR